MDKIVHKTTSFRNPNFIILRKIFNKKISMIKEVYKLNFKIRWTLKPGIT